VKASRSAKAGVHAPILVLGGFWPGEEKNLLQHNLTPAIHRCDTSRIRSRRRKTPQKNVSVQLKLTPHEPPRHHAERCRLLRRQLAKCKHLNLVGTFTHLASSEVLTDTELGQQTKQQIDRFYSTVERLRTLGADPGILHIANSAAIAARPETWADMVRPGAILYGYHRVLIPRNAALNSKENCPCVR